MTESLLTVSGLVKRFPVSMEGRRRTLTAVDGVDFDVLAGETVALIGESGSGKSTVARCIARLIEPTSGEVVLGGERLTAIPRRSVWKAYRDLQMVFQDPPSSLNPRMTARSIIEEPLRVHFALDRAERAARVDELLDQVRLRPELAGRFPRQLSGGECQRVAIARALAVAPRILLLDEPTASLDVSVRGEILDLLARIQSERGLAYLFISHDLQVVRRIASRVIVMYLGAIVERGTAADVFDDPIHPYTRALLSSAPTMEHGQRRARFRLAGEIPSATDLPAGCRLAGRCPLVIRSCTVAPPPLTVVSPTHSALCPVTVATAGRSEIAVAGR